jgi:predicted nucleic acid-binding protein
LRPFSTTLPYRFPVLAHPTCHQAAQVLSQFDARAHIVPVAPKAPATCKDPDDQKFIDLAVSHSATLLSKDKAVLCMRKRLMKLGVVDVGVEWRQPRTVLQ